MPNTLIAMVASLAVVLTLFLLFRIVSGNKAAAIGALVIYLIIGGFIAMAQTGGGGACQSWRHGGYWKPLVNWPGDIVSNVYFGDISLRQYFIPRTCEEEPQ